METDNPLFDYPITDALADEAKANGWYTELLEGMLESVCQENARLRREKLELWVKWQRALDD